VAKDIRNNGAKVNIQKNSSKLKREERLASALKKNIKLRKENKNNC
tara:strand:+ start:21 stop:158 length:138 start_codon:yes stop_codon:yes gene_type:complete